MKTNEEILDEMGFLDGEGKPLKSGSSQWIQWISVKDKLPELTTLENSPNVLITDNEQVSIGWYEYNPEEITDEGLIFPEEQLWHDSADILSTNYNGWPKVTHWTPLPNPPK